MMTYNWKESDGVSKVMVGNGLHEFEGVFSFYWGLQVNRHVDMLVGVHIAPFWGSGRVQSLN
jgi:hypothetical protein